jgi:hypothetical protein
MADLIVVEELQTYLVDQGVGQLPGATVSDVLPSIWLAPRDGAPEPRDGENVTVTLIDTNLAAAPDLEAWIEEAFVDVVVVARQNATAKLTQRAIRDLIHPMSAHGGKKMWTMGALLVEYSTVWRGDQPLTQNKQTYSRVQSFRFGARRKALAGLPLTP